MINTSLSRGTATGGTVAHRAPRQVRRVSWAAAWYLVMTILALGFLLPFIWMVATSLKSEAHAITIPPSFIPRELLFTNYVSAFQTVNGFLLNSIKLAAINVFGLLVVASLAGYAFARINFTGRDTAFLVLLGTTLIPEIVYLIPQYILFRKLGWIDTYFPLWVPRVLTPAFPTFLMRQYFKTIPMELEDAARVDGASTLRIYWNIMLPQVKPALAVVGIFTFVASWNDLFGPLIFLNSSELQTLPVALALFQNEFFVEVTLLMAAATIATAPVLIVFLAAQKYFIRGISFSGLQG